MKKEKKKLFIQNIEEKKSKIDFKIPNTKVTSQVKKQKRTETKDPKF